MERAARGRRDRLKGVAARITGQGDRQAARLAEARQDPNYRAGEHLATNIGRAPVWVFAVVETVDGTPTVVHDEVRSLSGGWDETWEALLSPPPLLGGRGIATHMLSHPPDRL